MLEFAEVAWSIRVSSAAGVADGAGAGAEPTVEKSLKFELVEVNLATLFVCLFVHGFSLLDVVVVLFCKWVHTKDLRWQTFFLFFKIMVCSAFWSAGR